MDPHNHLLMRSDVGTTRAPTHDLPALGHTYGKANAKDQYGAGSLLSSWHTHTATEAQNNDRDFNKMQKLAL